MTVILDSGGLSALSTNRPRLAELHRRGLWPAQVPAVVLTESLTGNHRRDVLVNKLLQTCQIRPVDELLARDAARLRTATRRAARISATDTIVASFAASCSDPIVFTSDPKDLTALAEQAGKAVVIVPV